MLWLPQSIDLLRVISRLSNNPSARRVGRCRQRASEQGGAPWVQRGVVRGSVAAGSVRQAVLSVVALE